jgi:hypothetical protein
MTTTGDTMAEDVALRLRALAATRWVDRSDAATREALLAGADEIERLCEVVETLRRTIDAGDLAALALDLSDDKRVTEDGAEAVALAFVHACSGWTVARRIQQGGSGDWLLTSPSRKKMTLALEVSGTVTDDARRRLTVKLAQVAGVTEKRCVRAAVVVGFVGPEVLAATVEGEAVP